MEKQRLWGYVCLGSLLFVLFVQLFLSVRQESQTWDEGDHIFAGYMSIKTGDHGLNPEHPPLVKYVAALPLLKMQLKVPELKGRDFKIEAFMSGKDFLYKNDADSLLLRARLAASIFTFLTAILIFLAAREMFNSIAACIALALFVFEPNVLAHGAVVTTDMAISCFMFATIYAFYRYLKSPTGWRLAVVGLAAGLALAAKHTGILVFPMLVVVAIADWMVRRKTQSEQPISFSKSVISLLAIGVLAVGVLWVVYGFRYQARPEGLQLNPVSAEYFSRLKPMDRFLVTTTAKMHLLPESYLYGLADIRMLADYMPTYIFGKVYAHGVWYYFPVAFVIKSTLAFMIFLLLACFAVWCGTLRKAREVLFLTLPPLVHFAVAMTAGLNIGARHILPLWVFFSVLAGGAAAALIARRAAWKYAIATLVLFHAFSSLRSFPVYLAYSNELWGGASKTHLYLSDSNTDWAQQLKYVKRYLDERGSKECWFSYFAGGAVDISYYGIPCKELPNADTIWFNVETDVPREVQGPVLISYGSINGFEFGSAGLNPYKDFLARTPTTVIQHGIAVFDGKFDLHYASALSRAQKARNLLEAKKPEEALVQAQSAVETGPEVIDAQTALGDALVALGRRSDARLPYQKAIAEAEKLEPAKQDQIVPDLQRKIREL
jgi:hypothetical protein